MISVPDADALNVEPRTRKRLRGGTLIDLLQVGSNCWGQGKHLIIRDTKQLQKHGVSSHRDDAAEKSRLHLLSFHSTPAASHKLSCFKANLSALKHSGCLCHLSVSEISLGVALDVDSFDQ